MSYYSNIPDLFNRYPDDHEDPRLAGKLEVGEWSNPLFQAIRDWEFLELTEGPLVLITTADHWVTISILTDMPRSEELELEERLKLTAEEILASREWSEETEHYCQVVGSEVCLLDVRTGDNWMTYSDVKEHASKIGIPTLPEIRKVRKWSVKMTQRVALHECKRGLKVPGILGRHEYLTLDGFPVRWTLRTGDFPLAATIEDVSVGLANIRGNLLAFNEMSSIFQDPWVAKLSEVSARITVEMDQVETVLQVAPPELLQLVAEMEAVYKSLHPMTVAITELSRKLERAINYECDRVSGPSASRIAEMLVDVLHEYAPETLSELTRPKSDSAQLGKTTDFVPSEE